MYRFLARYRNMSYFYPKVTRDGTKKNQFLSCAIIHIQFFQLSPTHMYNNILCVAEKGFKNKNTISLYSEWIRAIFYSSHFMVPDIVGMVRLVISTLNLQRIYVSQPIANVWSNQVIILDRLFSLFCCLFFLISGQLSSNQNSDNVLYRVRNDYLLRFMTLKQFQVYVFLY